MPLASDILDVLSQELVVLFGEDIVLATFTVNLEEVDAIKLGIREEVLERLDLYGTVNSNVTREPVGITHLTLFCSSADCVVEHRNREW